MERFKEAFEDRDYKSLRTILNDILKKRDNNEINDVLSLIILKLQETDRAFNGPMLGYIEYIKIKLKDKNYKINKDDISCFKYILDDTIYYVRNNFNINELIGIE